MLTKLIDCEVHTKWQTNSHMRWTLLAIRGSAVLLFARKSNKYLITESDQIFPVRNPHKVVRWSQTKRCKPTVQIFLETGALPTTSCR